MRGWACVSSDSVLGSSLYRKRIGEHIDLYALDAGTTVPEEQRFSFWAFVMSHRGEYPNPMMIVEPTYAPTLITARDSVIACAIEWFSARNNEIIESLHAPNMN
jgi:hypothetical protein